LSGQRVCRVADGDPVPVAGSGFPCRSIRCRTGGLGPVMIGTVHADGRIGKRPADEVIDRLMYCLQDVDHTFFGSAAVSAVRSASATVIRAVLGNTRPAVRIRCQVTTIQLIGRTGGLHCPTSATTNHSQVAGRPGLGEPAGRRGTAGAPTDPAAVISATPGRSGRRS